MHAEIVDDYKEIISKITYCSEYEDREDEIMDLVDMLPKRLIKEIQKQVQINLKIY